LINAAEATVVVNANEMVDLAEAAMGPSADQNLSTAVSPISDTGAASLDTSGADS
jgi:hypothetical protein